MANWCNNIVIFEGDEETLRKIKKMVLEMIQRESETNQGQTPPFAEVSEDYFFNIRWEEDVMYYQTKWAPNNADVLNIADYYKCDYEYEFDELGSDVYGKAIYRNNILAIYELDSADFNNYQETEWGYHFENEHFNSEFEILDELLNRKMKQHRRGIIL